ncbi:hypothetical protein GobsT_50240 [Gemmata obscuriglobus]|uniref:Uncharacterized protein n=1 Tax=Gemmata obscuriglobus TaxID=114 RepID=A0A2Z3H1Q6_9BACT
MLDVSRKELWAMPSARLLLASLTEPKNVSAYRLHPLSHKIVDRAIALRYGRLVRAMKPGELIEDKMRCYPEDEYDQQEAKKLGAADWMLNVLNANPAYCSWGPHEDYMWKEGDGWDSRVLKESWDDFGPWELDHMNEVVNFYFAIGRDSKECPTCVGRFYHPDSQWVSESFYSHSSPFKRQTERDLQGKAIMARFGGDEMRPIHSYGIFPDEATQSRYGMGFRAFCEEMRLNYCWHDRITQDEVDALIEAGRLHDLTSDWSAGSGWQKKEPLPAITPEMVNARQGRGLDSHDGINRSILIRARLKRLGLPEYCPQCDGDGTVFTSDQPHLSLVLWVLHPRKGCSRGVEIKNIQRHELPVVRDWLTSAANRNADRFSKLLDLAA